MKRLLLKTTAAIRCRQHWHTRTLEPCLSKASTAIPSTFRVVTEPGTYYRHIRVTMHLTSRSEQQYLSRLIVLCRYQSLSCRLIDQAHHHDILNRHLHAEPPCVVAHDLPFVHTPP